MANKEKEREREVMFYETSLNNKKNSPVIRQIINNKG